MASEHFKERFAANMSAQEWQALVDAMEELGPLRQTEVEAAQVQILQKFRSDDPLV